MSETKKYYCPCCVYDTLIEEPPGTYNICKICFWEDDPSLAQASAYAYLNLISFRRSSFGIQS
ncbi:MAG: CPCC family cysteine-rich protein [Balneola sp.]